MFPEKLFHWRVNLMFHVAAWRILERDKMQKLLYIWRTIFGRRKKKEK